MQQPQGQIRIGRCKLAPESRVFPSYSGFTSVVVLTKSSEYGSLGPYELRDEGGRIMENIWQFSKVYPRVPQVEIPYSANTPNRIAWKYPEEVHVGEDGEPNDLYWRWREQGMKNPIAVRYPVGRENSSRCAYALERKGGARLGYVAARKAIYLPLYVRLVQKEDQFRELKQRLDAGENLLIIETDGPHQESLEYYEEKYGVQGSFIEQDTMLATPRNVDIMLNDPRHPFGHGYCLAVALKGWNVEDFQW